MDKSNHSGSKMWQNLCFEQIKNVAKLVFSRDQDFGEKIENLKWLEYVANFMFAA